MTTTMVGPALKATGLRKSFGEKTALDGIHLNVAEGSSFFALLGPNGAGKTTTVHILSHRLDAGRPSVVRGVPALHSLHRDDARTALGHGDRQQRPPDRRLVRHHRAHRIPLGVEAVQPRPLALIGPRLVRSSEWSKRPAFVPGYTWRSHLQLG